jgi:hypothetical protein
VSNKESNMTVQLVGTFHDRDLDGVHKAAATVGMAVHANASVGAAFGRLRAAAPPACVLVGGGVELKRFVDAVRDEVQLFTLPVLACVAAPDAALFAAACLTGVDDVLVSGDVGGLSRRLSHLARPRSDQRPQANLGRVLVCTPDVVARRRIGRTLRQVGFEVEYASDLSGLRARGVAAPLFAVAAGVASSDVEHRRAGIGDVARIDAVPVLFLDLDDEQARNGDAQIVDATGRLLFFADERVKAEFKDRRGSNRKLYATVCSLREPGRNQVTFGVTYNISRDGMYIRTYDPPRPGTHLWLELDAPGSGVPLHLRCTAVWQRLPGAGRGVIPPGFGLSLDRLSCPSDDYREFLEGYTALPG